MNNKQWVFTLIVIAMVVGCATPHTAQTTSARWEGQNLSTLQQTWGKPDNTSKLPNGNTLYIYKREQLYTTQPMYPTASTSFVQIDGKNRYIASYDEAVQGNTITHYCRTWFEINTKGIVVKTQAQGNGCINLAPLPATS